MLAEIPTQMDESYSLRKFLRQLGAHRLAVVGRAVIDQDDLEGGRSEDLCCLLN